MLGNIVLFVFAGASVTTALPTNLSVKSFMDGFVATMQAGGGMAAGNVAGQQGAMNAGVIVPRKGAGVHPGLLASNGTEHYPQLKPLYITLLVLACFLFLITVMVSLIKCTDCFSCCRRSRAARREDSAQDREQGMMDLTTIQPSLSVPRAARIRVESPTLVN